MRDMLTKEQKVEALTGMVASVFTHYKKILTSNSGHVCCPPTPQESKAAYLSDPIINRCADAVVAGFLSIYEEPASCPNLINGVCEITGKNPMEDEYEGTIRHHH